VEILLTVADPVADELGSLAEWLGENPALLGKVKLTSTVAVEGAQGPGADALTVALGSGGTLTALALCLKTWIKAHYAQRNTSVHVEVVGPDGKTVIDASNAADAEALLRQVMRDEQLG
jgi:cysteine synthase